jgi:hypothetical protein
VPTSHTKLDQMIKDTRSTFSLLDESQGIVSLLSEDPTITLRLDATNQDELSAHFARYLCIIVSGFVERGTKQLVGDYIQMHTQTAPQVHRFVQAQLADLWGINLNKFTKLVKALDSDWWTTLNMTRRQELESLNGLSALRNKIAHGEDVTTTV